MRPSRTAGPSPTSWTRTAGGSAARSAATWSRGYLYDPAGRVIAETDGSGAVVELFAYDDLGHLALIAARVATPYRVITDAVGSPRLVIAAANGAVGGRDRPTTRGAGSRDETHPGIHPVRLRRRPGRSGHRARPFRGPGLRPGHRALDQLGPDPLRAAATPTCTATSAEDPVNRTDPIGHCQRLRMAILCGHGSWNGGNPDLHGCYGSACIRWCWYECNNPD